MASARRENAKFDTWEDFSADCLAASADGESRATGLMVLSALFAVASVVLALAFGLYDRDQASEAEGAGRAWAFWLVLVSGLSVAAVLGGLGSILRISAKRLRLEVFAVSQRRDR